MFRRLLRRLVDELIVRCRAPSEVRQSGAIPYRMVDGAPMVLIVTSRGSGRWIYPKGSPMTGLTASQVAVREAFEEAGIEGEIEREILGSYLTVKRGKPGIEVIAVDMFPLLVQRELTEWQEKHQRQRRWVSPPEAERLLSDPALAQLTAVLARRLADAARVAPA